jgi:hypothetical protein
VTVDPTCVDRNESIFNTLPAFVLYQHRLHRVLTGALAAIMRSTDLDCTGEHSLLNSLLEYSDGQAQQLAPVDDNGLGESAIANDHSRCAKHKFSFSMKYILNCVSAAVTRDLILYQGFLHSTPLGF